MAEAGSLSCTTEAARVEICVAVRGNGVKLRKALPPKGKPPPNANDRSRRRIVKETEAAAQNGLPAWLLPEVIADADARRDIGP